MRTEKRVTGELYFNGLTADEQLAAGQYIEKMCGLIAQGDCHMANLTVRETFKFAVESSVADPSLLDNVDPKLLAWHRRKVDLLLSVLGMHECADTIAGNAVIRGISGGQKKRLTIGEFMITNARVLLMDEPTTGLDAAVARDIMVVLRKWCTISGGTVISALLQPTPECYELYDNVILMKEGHIVYQGPRQDIPHFLWHYHGLEVAQDADIADFLVDWLTDPTLVYQRQKKRWAKKGGPTTAPQRLTLEEEDEIKRRRSAQAQLSQDEAEAGKEQLRQEQEGREDMEEQKRQAEAVYVQPPSYVDVTPPSYDSAVGGSLQQVSAQLPQHNPQPSPSKSGPAEPAPIPSTAAVRLTNEDMVAAYHSSPYYAEQQVAVDKVHTERQGADLTERVRQAAASASLYSREQYSRRYARSYWDHTNASTREAFVDELIDLLELTAVKDRIVGNENYVGLSPGQLKLLTIGVELVSNPSILFLDEPTSGLDSRAALVVMRVVKNIAATGRTVLCTIHQPSSEVFYLFDYLLLLKSGGETVYFGPLGDEGADIVQYFEHDGLTGAAAERHKRRPDGPRKPPGMNPASWMLDVIGAGVSGALSRAIQKQDKQSGDQVEQQRQQTKETALELTDASSVVNVSSPAGIDYAALYASSALAVEERQNASALKLVDPSQRVEVRLADYHIPAWQLLRIVLRSIHLCVEPYSDTLTCSGQPA